MPLHTKYPASQPEYIRAATIDDLKSRELFEEIDESSLKALLEHSILCKLNAHKSLLATRDGVDYLYVITSGYVAIWLASRLIHMGENFLAWRGPEQIIGEMRSIGDKTSEARITTCEPCEFIELRSDALTSVAEVTPRIYRNVARLLMEKLHQERHRAEVIQITPAERKVAQTLLYLVEERCRKPPVYESKVCGIPGVIHQDEIGAYIGAERETINRILRRFKSDKMITYTGNKHGCEITVLDRKRLSHIARAPSIRRRRALRGK
ncbi:MAG: Crp/Fnr family transcriptional regulator [Acidobacteriota bacterium]|nr:Crp/Fnr family transcriptional regulator [Acidobacteriota bacterium]